MLTIKCNNVIKKIKGRQEFQFVRISGWKIKYRKKLHFDVVICDKSNTAEIMAVTKWTSVSGNP